MANNILTATISADGSRFTKTLGDLQAQLKRFEAGLKNVGSAESFNRLNRAIDATKARMASLGGVQKTFTSSSNQATQSLVNLSRVAQDAPYGFIGIANNLNPLIESFQRLKASTGTTGGALKALRGALTGPAGIGLAVGVVSSLFVAFGDKLFGTSKAAKEAAEANEKLAQSISGEIVKLTSLVAIASNVNKSQEERKKAIAAINQEYGKYLGSLDKEKTTLENIAASYDKIIEGMLKQAVVKGLQEEIEKTFTETAKQIIGAEKAEAKRVAGLEKANRVNKQNADSIKLIGRATQDGFLAQQKSVQITNAQIQAASSYDTVIKRLKDNLKKELAGAFGILEKFDVKDLNINLAPPKDKNVPKEVKDYVEELPKLIPPVPLSFTVDVDSFRDVLMGKKIKSFAEFFNDKLTSEIQKLVHAPTFNFTPDVKARLDTSFSFKNFDGLTESQAELAKIGETIANTITPAFDAMVSAIAKGENAFKAFGQGVIQILIGVISKLVQTAILAAILSAIFPMGVGGTKGFGNIFSKLLGFGGRAAGGPVDPGRGYIVGENGPEFFTPNSAGRIVSNPAMAMTSSMGGGGGQYTFRIIGYDLVAVVNRNQLRQRRLQ